jgi:hypothetical protein
MEGRLADLHSRCSFLLVEPVDVDETQCFRFLLRQSVLFQAEPAADASSHSWSAAHYE